MKQKRSSRLPWIFVVLLSFVLAFVIAIIVLPKISAFAEGFGMDSSSHDSRSISSLSLDEEVVLMSLGIQGIKEQSQNSTLFGKEVPGTSRTSFMQYEFSAKVGFNGNDVKIEEVKDNTFKISIPRFKFIGHDDIVFKLITEDNGVLGWVTPEIDTVEMTNEVLNDDTEAEYLGKNGEILRHQTETYFSTLINNIDPAVVLEFEYTE